MDEEEVSGPEAARLMLCAMSWKYMAEKRMNDRGWLCRGEEKKTQDCTYNRKSTGKGRAAQSYESKYIKASAVAFAQLSL